MLNTFYKMSNFEKKTLEDGSVNPKYVNLLDEDPTISGQKYVCVSFVSPETILKKKEMFLFERFVQDWDYTKSLKVFTEFLGLISHNYNINMKELADEFNEFLSEEAPALRKELSVEDDFKNFLDMNEEKLTGEFSREHAFQTNVRGLKIRGAFATEYEAEARCKKLREMDPHHDIFVGPVGVWIPWEPDAYKTGRLEYAEEKLNELHKQKLLNQEKAKLEFENRKKKMTEKAILENIKKAEESGNVLTQTLNEEGKLIGVKETVNFEEREVADSTLRDELFKTAVENAKKRDADK